MPLDIARLFESDFYILSNGDEFKAGLTLWGKAFQRVPAGSLPDDDRLLAHLSGAGPAWPTVRDMALHGWVKCSDGRLYHPVVAEKACDAWAQRLAYRKRTQAATAARQAQRQRDGLHDDERHVERYVGRGGMRDDERDVHQGEGEGDSREGFKKERTPSESVSRAARGARLPDDWQPDADLRRFAADLGLDAASVAASFRDYWRAQAGAKARKADWPATWRNWCRHEAERSATRRSPQVPSSGASRRTTAADHLVALGLAPDGTPLAPQHDIEGELI
jgi:hypothetical protein